MSCHCTCMIICIVDWIGIARPLLLGPMSSRAERLKPDTAASQCKKTVSFEHSLVKQRLVVSQIFTVRSCDDVKRLHPEMHASRHHESCRAGCRKGVPSGEKKAV